MKVVKDNDTKIVYYDFVNGKMIEKKRLKKKLTKKKLKKEKK